MRDQDDETGYIENINYLEERIDELENTLAARCLCDFALLFFGSCLITLIILSVFKRPPTVVVDATPVAVVDNDAPNTQQCTKLITPTDAVPKEVHERVV